MPGGWQVGSSWSNSQDINGANTLGLNGGGAANAKGAWTQVIASTPYDSMWALVQYVKLYGYATAAVDVGIGPSGSEIALVSGLVNSSYPECACSYLFPLSIKAGTRVAARAQMNAAGWTVYSKFVLFNDTALAGATGSAIDTYGFNATLTQGATVDPGATASTKGAWVQLTASTTAALDGFFLGFDNQGRSTGSSNGNDVWTDIAIGPSGSEQIVLPNFYNNSYNNSQQLLIQNSMYFPIPIPAGSRIAARTQSTYTGSDRAIGVTLYGVRQ